MTAARRAAVADLAPPEGVPRGELVPAAARRAVAASEPAELERPPGWEGALGPAAAAEVAAQRAWQGVEALVVASRVAGDSLAQAVWPARVRWPVRAVRQEPAAARQARQVLVARVAQVEPAGLSGDPLLVAA